MLHLRNPIQFDCPAGVDDGTRKKVRETLAKELEGAVGDVLSIDDFRNSQPVPPAPPVFRRQSPQDGLGKFRKPGEPLGVSETFPHIAQDVMLSEGPVVWFRLMPTIETGRTWPVMELKNAAMHGALLHPIGNGWREFNYLRGADGFGIYAPLREPRDLTSNVVFAFTSGELWTIDSYILDALMRDKRSVILPMENEFRKTLEEYSSFLTKLGIAPPFRWIAGMENLKGRSLIDEAGRMAAFRGPTGVCLSDVVIEEGTHSPGEAPGKSLEPFFTKLFDACGVGRPQARDT
jgi:hypothetical protein